MLFFIISIKAEEAANTEAEPVEGDKNAGETADKGKTAEGEDVPEEKCNVELLHTFGVRGLETPRYMNLEMFPSISASCCRKSDQLEIFGHWIKAGEGHKIKKHYMEMADSYGNLLEELIDVKNFATQMKQKLKTRKVSNCKLMANRITSFKIIEVMPLVKNNLRKMEEFFVQTYRGFYSALCNANSIDFIDVAEKKIIYSEKFCRDIVEHTVPTVLFWAVDVVKFFNLVSKFLVSCDYEGEFDNERKVPPELIFEELEEERKMLKSCKSNVNEVSWFSQCKFLCSKFNIVRFEPFFEPHRGKIKKYTEFVKETLEDIKESEGGISLFNSAIIEEENTEEKPAAEATEGKAEEGAKKEPAKQAERVLSEEPTSDTEKEGETPAPIVNKEVEQQLADNADPLKPTEPNPLEQLATSDIEDKEDALNGGSIFKGGLEKKLDLSTFTPVFELEGLSLYSSGKTTLINQETNDEIKVKIAMQRHEESMRIYMEKKLQKMTGDKATPKTIEDGTGENTERQLSSSYLVKTAVISVMLLFITL